MSPRLLAALIISIVAPLLAVRQSLSSLRCLSCQTRWPQIYPAPELAAGLLRTIAVAGAAGLACFGLLGRSIDLTHAGNMARIAAPLVVAFAALYSRDIFALSKPGGGKSAILIGSLTAITAWLSLASFGAILDLPGLLRWLITRWSEALIGYPCLIVGFRAQLARVEREKKREFDPRPWLMLGLLGPIGTVHVVTQMRVLSAGILMETASVMSVAIVAAFALMASRRAGFSMVGRVAALCFALAIATCAMADDKNDPHKGSVFVSVELDLSDHPGDLRDAAAGLTQTAGFQADPRFPPRFTGENRERAEIWGWLPQTKLDEALPGAAVDRVEIERLPDEAVTKPVPPPAHRPHPPVELASVSFEPLRSGFMADHLGQLLLLGFLTVLGFVILRSPKKIARITKRLLPKNRIGG